MQGRPPPPPFRPSRLPPPLVIAVTTAAVAAAPAVAPARPRGRSGALLRERRAWLVGGAAAGAGEAPSSCWSRSGGADQSVSVCVYGGRPLEGATQLRAVK